MDSENNYSFTPEQLEQFKKFLNAEGKQKLNEFITETDQAQNELTSNEKVKDRVFKALAEVSGKDQNEIRESQDLYRDLGLSIYHKKSLSRPFQKIVEDFGSDKKVLVKECGALIKVKDCLDLVSSKI